jgi:hypothetical protein
MILSAYLLTLSIGALFGASLMLLAVARAESWRAQQQARWFGLWLKEWSRADKAESALRAIHEKHVAAGKARHRKERLRVIEVASTIPFQPLRQRSEVIADDSLLPERSKAA